MTSQNLLVEELKKLLASMRMSRMGGTGPSIRKHCCSSCGLTDEEEAGVYGWNDAMDLVADKIDEILARETKLAK